LNGQTLNPPLAAPPQVYFNFPASMLLPSGGTGTVTQIVDPFGYSYGYSTAYQADMSINNMNGTNIAPANGFNPTFDLWSTGGQVIKKTDTPATILQKRGKWIINWQNSGSNPGQ
jgi:hypothetical protein